MKKDIKTDKNGLNIKIDSHILSSEKMRHIGFTNNVKDIWYYSKMVKFPNCKKYKNIEITFNVSIPTNGNRLRIDILDEDFCQPYDYQYILENNNNFEVAIIVRNFVEDQMEYLQNQGVISGHIRGEYI